MPNTFQHKDFYLCAYLIVQNCQLLKHERIGNTTTFTFAFTADLEKHINDFYSLNTAVDAMKYSIAIRSLKSMIHSNATTYSHSTFDRQDLNHESNNKQWRN